MAFDGNGTFNRVHSWADDATNGINITASRMDAEDDGIATGLTTCVTKDGQTTPTANLPMGGYRHTGVDDGAARNDYAAVGQLQDNAASYAVDSGSANAVTAALSPAITAYATGMRVAIKINATNTGATTLALNGLAAKPIELNGGSPMHGGELAAGHVALLVYDGDHFNLVNEPANKGNNAIINSAMQVAQRQSASLSTSYAFGEVDRYEVKAGGTVGAGTIEQTETTLIGETGFALSATGVTLTGDGEIYFRQRITSTACRGFIDSAATFYCHVYHDVGSAKNATVTINKADAEDDFSAVTQISASSNVSVSSATDSVLVYTVADMGSCGNGIEIIVKIACGAVTTKLFHTTEWLFVKGEAIGGFETPSFDSELIRCRRYYFAVGQTYPYTTSSVSLGVGAARGTTQVDLYFRYPVIMRAIPARTYTNYTNWVGYNGASGVNPTAFTDQLCNEESVRFYITSGSPSWAAGEAVGYYSGGATLIEFDAEF